jgi:hypothetical protein
VVLLQVWDESDGEIRLLDWPDELGAVGLGKLRQARQEGLPATEKQLQLDKQVLARV